MKTLALLVLLVLPLGVAASESAKPFAWLHGRTCKPGSVCYFPVGSRDAKTSPDGAFVGWIVEFSASDRAYPYPMPMELAIRGVTGDMHAFKTDVGVLAGWCFTADSQAVVYGGEFPHGPTDEWFVRRRIRDGKLLNKFHLAAKYVGVPVDRLPAAVAMPDWARCAAGGDRSWGRGAVPRGNGYVASPARRSFVSRGRR